MASESHSPERSHRPCNPILIEAIKGNAVDNFYRGSYSVVDAHGHVIMAVGDIESPVFPGSGIKPIQALTLCETGAAKAYGLGHANVALACSNHNGDPIHTEIIRNWLHKIDCAHEDLVCGESNRGSKQGKENIATSGGTLNSLNDPCSGKHAGFLTVARHLRHPTLGYHRMDHPVQQRIIGILEQMTGLDLYDAPKALDSSGIPTIGIPLGNISLAMARMANPHDQPEERQAACKRVITAMTMEPYLLAGKGRFTTRVIEALGQSCIIQRGSQGVYCSSLVKRGIGIAIKIDDGSLRAAEAVMMRLLYKLNVLTERALGLLLNLLEPPIFSRNGEVIGTVKPAYADLK